MHELAYSMIDLVFVFCKPALCGMSFLYAYILRDMVVNSRGRSYSFEKLQLNSISAKKYLSDYFESF